MDCFGDDEYQLYWETNMYLQSQELESCWGIKKDAIIVPCCYNKDDVLSNSIDETLYSDASAAKNIINERIRRKRVNERLMALRAVVPNITKMDKATIITDAIKYIKELKEQVQRIEADIRNLEERRSLNNNGNHCSLSSAFVSEQNLLGLLMESITSTNNSIECDQSSLIDDLNIKVSYAGNKTLIVSLTCANRKGAMTKMCESFEGLKLNVITTHISAFSGIIIKTVYIEAEEQEKDYLKSKIELVLSSCI